MGWNGILNIYWNNSLSGFKTILCLLQVRLSGLTLHHCVCEFGFYTSLRRLMTIYSYLSFCLLELDAYHSLVWTFRAQGRLTANKLRLMKEVAAELYIPDYCQKLECGTAMGNGKLNEIAEWYGQTICASYFSLIYCGHYPNVS